MTEPAETRLVRYSPAELVDAVRSGRIRYPDPGRPRAIEVARTMNGLRRGFPVRPLLLWQTASDDVQWVLDGGELVDALLVATGSTERWADDEPLLLDTDTGEVVSWGQMPARDHDLLALPGLLRAHDVEEYLSEHRVVGDRTERIRSLLAALDRSTIVAQITDLPRSDLPALVRRLPARRGVRLDQLDVVFGPEPGPRPEWYAWEPSPQALVTWARGGFGLRVSDEAMWRVLVVAEGGDPDTPYDPSAEVSGLSRDGRDAVRAVRDGARALRGWFLLGGEQLLPDLGLLAVMARFERVFGVLEEPVRPLLRRWFWRAALAEDEVDLSQEALSVIRDDAADSAVRLLARTPAPPLRPPGREPIDVASRRGRMVLQGIASLHPRDLTTGELVDVEQTGVRPILRDRPTEPANLLLHDHVWSAGLRGEVDAILRTRDAALLGSHGIDDVGVQLLRDRQDEAFLARRSAELDRAVVRLWTRRVQPDAPARRPVALLFGDDHG